MIQELCIDLNKLKLVGSPIGMTIMIELNRPWQSLLYLSIRDYAFDPIEFETFLQHNSQFSALKLQATQTDIQLMVTLLPNVQKLYILSKRNGNVDISPKNLRPLFALTNLTKLTLEMFVR